MSLIKQGINDVSNLKDILLTYNKITEECFSRCTSNFNSRELTDLEKSCVDGCCFKHVNSNQRMMVSFMQIQSNKQKQMMEEVEKQQGNIKQQTNNDSLIDQSHDKVPSNNTTKPDAE
ncbi:hypothetical protein LSH36_53g06073 [Paralvinella palmiformis]|uniref:Mitochondrial import inner membrane translocase subunit n=1 Tax=Paralvinella palmiformis TaxID=53620 RepID=A0AAD9K646_9ANNE|nr:hypothetical protein LSH36_53g06073 [Paralvinella palmiformis]